MQAKTLLVALVVSAAVCPSSWAQGPAPLTPEIMVDDGSNAGERALPAVAFGSDGGFLVVWRLTITNIEQRIMARRFFENGSPNGAIFRVDGFTGSKNFPAVAALPGGNYVVAWEEGVASVTPGTDTSGSSVRARIYGGPGSEFQVNTTTNLNQGRPAVAAMSNGNFVIAWQSDSSGGTDQSSTSIQMQRYSASGTPLGSEFQVNTSTAGGQISPAVAAGAGGFVVAWPSHVSETDLDYNVKARRFDASGGPLGNDFQVNTYATGWQISPSLAVGSTNDFFIVWKSGEFSLPGPDGSNSSIQGRRYDAGGAPLGDEFQINTHYIDLQGDPAIARDVDGDFVVLWFDSVETGDSAFLPGCVRGQRFNIDGSRRGTEFRANTFIPNAQDTPDLAIGAGGDFLAVWRSIGQGVTGDPTIMGRLFSGSQALALDLDFHTLAPCRVVDTRSGAPLASDSLRTFPIAGVCGIPATAKSIAANVAVVGPTGDGYIKLWPADLPETATSVINFSSGMIRANNSLASLATDASGGLSAKASVGAGGSVHLVIDVTGYFE